MEGKKECEPSFLFIERAVKNSVLKGYGTVHGFRFASTKLKV
jgi:hypothetical protein